MQEARFPQRSENSQHTTAISKPVHDWTSHPRTATEYFAVNYKEPVKIDNRPLAHVDPNFDPYQSLNSGYERL